MSPDVHVRSAEIAAFVAGKRALPSDEQLVLAFHLAIGCEDCWQALDSAEDSWIRWHPSSGPDPAGQRIPFSLCYSEILPLLRALRRIGSPARSWAALRSTHLEAVRRVREETWGFARLVLEEADLLIEEDVPSADFERLLGLPRNLVRVLVALDPACAVGADLQARLELVRAHASIYERPERASEALARAGWFLKHGTGSGSLKIELLLSRARHAFYRGDGVERIGTYVDRSQALVGTEEHLRRVEVGLTGVRHQELNLFARTGDPSHLRYGLVKCLRLERVLRSEPDPLHRLSGLIQQAELAVLAKLVAEVRLRRRTHMPALVAFAGVLESHLTGIAGDVDLPIIESFQRAIAWLRSGAGAPGRFNSPEVRPSGASIAGGSPLFQRLQRFAEV